MEDEQTLLLTEAIDRATTELAASAEDLHSLVEAVRVLAETVRSIGGYPRALPWEPKGKEVPLMVSGSQILPGVQFPRPKG